jgi:toxin ParE1/3/4
VSKTAVHYTDAAERDLDAVAAYTVRVWGIEQCESYLRMLEEVCEKVLPRHPNLAHLVPGYDQLFSWKVEHHVVYYRKVRGGIEIVRVLHERQLPARQLKR